jgi:hypothetical protein
MGWRVLEGNGRPSFGPMVDRGGFAWLTASKPPELVLFAPQRRADNSQGELPGPCGHAGRRRDAGLRGDLATEVARAYIAGDQAAACGAGGLAPFISSQSMKAISPNKAG